MLSDQRQYEITELICREGKASISELAARFGVSGETIRRDLNAIEKSGRVRKVHGGAVAVRHPIRDQSYAARQVNQAHSKQCIANLAATLPKNNQVIGIDSGTCAESFARAIRGLRGLTVITPSIPIATILSAKVAAGELDATICLPGGTVNPETGTVNGMATLMQLQNYRMDLAFVSVTAISESGMMAGTEKDGMLTAALLRQADSVYVLAESEKLGKQSYYRIADFHRITALVTDDTHPMGEELKRALTAAGTGIYVAPTEGKKGDV